MTKERVIAMYRELERFLQSEAYGKDLEMELEKANPGFINSIQKRIRDMNEADHGIVIAGETSAGKSTLVNKILEKNIFIDNTLESTSTICKIRNLETVEIIAKSKDGYIYKRDLSQECDMSSESGEEILRTLLSELTDMTVSKESIDFEYVDVGFPIPFLKGNSVLVDTPGIGGSGEVTQKLMDYLPSAISFIFVINVGSAGGLQSDRLPKILMSLNELQIKDEMPCFDPENVIFITNKWDGIKSMYGVEKAKKDLWETINNNIKRHWPCVQEKHIFRMNIIDVNSDSDIGNTSTEEFRKFQEVLLSNIEKAKNIRIERHVRFLKDLLTNVSKGLNARLQLKEMSAKEQQTLAEEQLEDLEKMMEECAARSEMAKQKTKEEIEKVTDECYTYMQSTNGKEKILNPEGQTPIMDVRWDKSIGEEIQKRIVLYIETFLKSERITKLFQDIRDGDISYYKKVSQKISIMEAKWTDLHKKKRDANEYSEGYTIPSFLETPLIVIGVVLMVVVGVIFIALSPILVPALLFFFSAKRKKELKKEFINKVYRTYMLSIKMQIRNHLNETCGNALLLFSGKILNVALPNQIRHLQNIIQNLQQSREKILENTDSSENLAKKVESMKMCASELEFALLDKMSRHKV